jgi:outer membrane protein assembly factor BamB
VHPSQRTTISCRWVARTTSILFSLTLAVATAGRAGAQTVPVTPLWSVAVPAPPAFPPVVVHQVIVVPLRTGAIAAYALSDGKEMWKSDIAAEQALAGADGRVFVAAGEALHALDAATGAAVWRRPAGGRVTAPPLAHGGWIIAAVGGQLAAFRASDGSEVWRKAVGPVEFRPALDGDLLVVPVIEGRVLALNVENGEQRWSVELGAVPTEPTAVGDRVYVGTALKRFLTIDARSGYIESTWRVGGIPRGRAAVDSRHVYVTALDNQLYVIDRKRSGLRWKKGLLYRPTAGPDLVAGTVLVPGYVHAVPLFVARSGDPVGEMTFPTRLATQPVFTQAADGRLLAIGITGSDDNKLTMTVLGPLVVATPALGPLTELPGVAVPLPHPPGG